MHRSMHQALISAPQALSSPLPGSVLLNDPQLWEGHLFHPHFPHEKRLVQWFFGPVSYGYLMTESGFEPRHPFI